jgi:hypothetical protein
MPDHNRIGRTYDQWNLIANKIFKGFNLMFHKLGNSLTLKICIDCFPLHSSFLRYVIRKSIYSFLITMEGSVTITKMGADAPKNMVIPKVEDPKLDGGRKQKPIKTFPKGILKTSKLKIKGVSDPTKHPRLKSFMRKHTLKLLTDTGVKHRRKVVQEKVRKLSDEKVKEYVIKHGLSKGNAPPKLLREILEGGMLSGFISS